jgi:hypothetical protein
MAKTNRTKKDVEKQMRALLKKYGKIAFSVTLRLKNPKNGQHEHYPGKSLTLQTLDIATALKYTEAIHAFATKLYCDMKASGAPIEGPDVIIVREEVAS